MLPIMKQLEKPSHPANGRTNGRIDQEHGARLRLFRSTVWATQRDLAREMVLARHGKLEDSDEKAAVGSIEDQLSRWERGGRRPKDAVLIEIAKLAKRRGYRRRSGGHLVALLRDIYRCESGAEWKAKFDVFRATRARSGGENYGGSIVVDKDGKVHLCEQPPSGPGSAAIVDTFGDFRVWEVEGEGWAVVYERFEEIKSAMYIPAGSVQTMIIPKTQKVAMESLWAPLCGDEFDQIQGYIRGAKHGS